MQYNTYYQKDVWEHFQKEEDKSKLVNRLLKQHYGSAPATPVVQASQATPEPEDEPNLSWLADDFPNIRFRGDFKQFLNPDTNQWQNTKGKFY